MLLVVVSEQYCHLSPLQRLQTILHQLWSHCPWLRQEDLKNRPNDILLKEIFHRMMLFVRAPWFHSYLVLEDQRALSYDARDSTPAHTPAECLLHPCDPCCEYWAGESAEVCECWRRIEPTSAGKLVGVCGPDPIYDQNMRFSLPYIFMTWPLHVNQNHVSELPFD